METFLLLLTAHLLGDFTLQTDGMVRHKARFGVLLGHVAIVGVVSLVLLGNLHGPILAVLFLSHLTLDFVKVATKNDGGVAFVLDQAGHLAVIAILAGIFPCAAEEGWWPEIFNTEEALAWFHVALCVVSGVILIAPVGGFMIGKLTEPISRELQDAETQLPGVGESGYVEGLPSGGKYIGWLERMLTMLLFLINQPAGIGFLIAAKSILRFGEIKESRHRKVAEYIIIGTFLSFGWALVVSASMKAGIDHWSPMPREEPKPVRVILENPESLRVDRGAEDEGGAHSRGAESADAAAGDGPGKQPQASQP